jgi:hypothetical protein
MTGGIVKRVYVNPQSGAIIICDQCGRRSHFGVAVFRQQMQVVRVNCTCGASFQVTIEKRKADRKPTYIVGSYAKIGSPDIAGKIVVENLSFFGLGFKTEYRTDIRVGDGVRLTFPLHVFLAPQPAGEETRRRVQVVKDADVKWVEENFIGAEFRNPAAYARAIEVFLALH